MIVSGIINDKLSANYSKLEEKLTGRDKQQTIPIGGNSEFDNIVARSSSGRRSLPPQDAATTNLIKTSCVLLILVK